MKRGMKNVFFSTNISLYFENGTRYSHIAVTMEDEYELVWYLSNGAIFNDLDRP